ncbi:hypothetical protein D3C73_1408170 [compost metagenome]
MRMAGEVQPQSDTRISPYTIQNRLAVIQKVPARSIRRPAVSSFDSRMNSGVRMRLSTPRGTLT